MTETIYTYQDLKDLVGGLFLTLPVIFKPLLPPEMQAAERSQAAAPKPRITIIDQSYESACLELVSWLDYN
jgi:hypothetical protein